MARFILLAAVGVGIYLWLRSGRGSLGRLLPPMVLGLALLYLISPIDLVPDVGLVGLLDDVAVLAAAALWARRHSGSHRRPAHPPTAPATQADPDRDPHEILGVQPGASAEEITRAYREKMKLYHPDRVNGLGQELQEMATEKTIEIQRAYECCGSAARSGGRRNPRATSRSATRRSPATHWSPRAASCRSSANAGRSSTKPPRKISSAQAARPRQA